MTRRTADDTGTPAPEPGVVFGEDADVGADPEDPERQKPAGLCARAQPRIKGRPVRGVGVWRVREDDLAAYIDAAYTKTTERIASGQVEDDEVDADD